jgi:hypothetical protein
MLPKMPQMQGARFPRNKAYSGSGVRCHDEEIEATPQMGYFGQHQKSVAGQCTTLYSCDLITVPCQALGISLLRRNPRRLKPLPATCLGSFSSRLGDSEEANIPSRIPPSGHFLLRLNRKILKVARLRLWSCAIDATEPDPNPDAMPACLSLQRLYG